MTPRTVLQHVRILIEQGWCQEAMARDAAGFATDVEDPTATKWCLDGAIGHVFGEQEHKKEIRQALCDVTGTDWLVDWNDKPGRTKEDVLRAIDQAQARLKGRTT